MSSAPLLAELSARDAVSAGAIERFADCPVKWLVESLLDPEKLAPDPEQMVRGCPSPRSTVSLSSLSALGTRSAASTLPTLSTTLATFGTCHQVTPVAQMLAASVRTTGVPRAAIAP